MSGMRLMRPHFVDPQTNIVYDTNAADYEGWLTKQSSWLKVCMYVRAGIRFLAGVKSEYEWKEALVCSSDGSPS